MTLSEAVDVCKITILPRKHNLIASQGEEVAHRKLFCTINLTIFYLPLWPTCSCQLCYPHTQADTFNSTVASLQNLHRLCPSVINSRPVYENYSYQVKVDFVFSPPLTCLFLLFTIQRTPSHCVTSEYTECVRATAKPLVSCTCTHLLPPVSSTSPVDDSLFFLTASVKKNVASSIIYFIFTYRLSVSCK